jgi:signal peptidase
MAVRTRERRRAGTVVGDILLTAGAVGGALCIVLVLLAVVFHISLIMFKTGSMSPTIPAGSLALVYQIPAAEARVGEVVTIDRPGALPISHRVTSVTDAGGQSRHITMRGDANPSDDPVPYTVSTVRQVLFSIPRLAYFVVFLSDPLVLGIITVAVAALVTWAFWPRERERTGGGRSRRGRRRNGARHSAATLALLALGGVGLLVLAPGTPAQADGGVQTTSGRFLTVTSIGDSAQMSHLVPGVSVPWQVGVAATTSNPGTVRLSLGGSGALVSDPSGLWLTISGCPTRWVGGTCPSGATPILGPEAASVALPGDRQLLTMPADEQRWLMIEVSLPPSGALARGSAVLELSAVGSGDTVTATAGGATGVLASTGTELWTPAVTAAIAVLGGIALARLSDRRRRRTGRRGGD